MPNMHNAIKVYITSYNCGSLQCWKSKFVSIREVYSGKAHFTLYPYMNSYIAIFLPKLHLGKILTEVYV